MTEPSGEIAEIDEKVLEDLLKYFFGASPGLYSCFITALSCIRAFYRRITRTHGKSHSNIPISTSRTLLQHRLYMLPACVQSPRSSERFAAATVVRVWRDSMTHANSARILLIEACVRDMNQGIRRATYTEDTQN